MKKLLSNVVTFITWLSNMCGSYHQNHSMKIIWFARMTLRYCNLNEEVFKYSVPFRRGWQVILCNSKCSKTIERVKENHHKWNLFELAKSSKVQEKETFYNQSYVAQIPDTWEWIQVLKGTNFQLFCCVYNSKS